MNKIDNITSKEARIRIERKYSNALIISAKTGDGINALEERIHAELGAREIPYEH